MNRTKNNLCYTLMFLAVIVLNGCQEPQSPRSQVYEYMRNLTADDYESALKVIADLINENHTVVKARYEAKANGGLYHITTHPTKELSYKESTIILEVKDYSFDNDMQEGVIKILAGGGDKHGIWDWSRRLAFTISFAFDDGRFFVQKITKYQGASGLGTFASPRDELFIEDLLGKLIEF